MTSGHCTFIFKCFWSSDDINIIELVFTSKKRVKYRHVPQLWGTLPLGFLILFGSTGPTGPTWFPGHKFVTKCRFSGENFWLFLSWQVTNFRPCRHVPCCCCCCCCCVFNPNHVFFPKLYSPSLQHFRTGSSSFIAFFFGRFIWEKSPQKIW